MEIIWNLNNTFRKSPSIISVGTFDGVHLGHREIIQRLNTIAKSKNGNSTLITFEPHPQLVLLDQTAPSIQLLTTIDEKIDILQKSGLDYLVIAHFTKELAATDPESFVSDVLLKQLSMSHIVIGHDHSFGKQRTGNIELLRMLGDEHNFSIEVVNPIEKEGMIISSTTIRKLIKEGSVEKAFSLLGRTYSIRGHVIKGNGRGKKLGFPTANLRPPSRYKLIPPNGVYAGFVRVKRTNRKCVISIGVRPTFNPSDRTIEVHIMDFNKSLYEEEIDVYFTHRIRDELRFNSTQELITQMKQDRQQSLELLKNFYS